MTYRLIGEYRYQLLQRLPITSKGEKKMSNRGILIAVEGMDGSGKSTQAKLL